VGLHQSQRIWITEKRWIDGLSDDNIDRVATQKLSIMMTGDWPAKEDFSQHMHPLLPLLERWFSLATTARADVKKFIQENVGCSRDVEEFAIGSETAKKPEELCVDY
jgi:hypothetical protein